LLDDNWAGKSRKILPDLFLNLKETEHDAGIPSKKETTPVVKSLKEMKMSSSK